MKARFNDEQLIALILEQEAGGKTEVPLVSYTQPVGKDCEVNGMKLE